MQIINHEIWDQSHAIKVKHASQRNDKRQTRKGLLTGLVRCGFCGGIITIIGRERYACPAHREQGTCTNATSIKAQDLEQRVFNGLKSILLGCEETMKAFAKAFHAEVKRHQTNTTLHKTTVQKDLPQLETGIKLRIDVLLHSDTPMESIRNKLEGLEVQSAHLPESYRCKQKKIRSSFIPILVSSMPARLGI